MQVMFLQKADQLFARVRTDPVLVVAPEINVAHGAVQRNDQPRAQGGEELPLLHILGQQNCEKQDVIQVNGQKIPRRPLVACNEDSCNCQVADPCIEDQKTGKPVLMLVQADKRRGRDHKYQHQRIEIVDKLGKTRE